jgi:iron complex transport system substrate-binding protein
MILLPSLRLYGAALAAVSLATAAAPVIVRDDTGATVKLAAPAQRIVSLAPHATELIFAVGAGARIVGTLDTSDWPPPAKAIPRVGDSRTLDLERIVALAPDLVVTWPWTAPAQVEVLRAQGVAVFTTLPTSIDGIATNLERLGVLTVGAPAGWREAEAFRARLSRLRARNADKRRVRVFYEIWDRPLYTIGGRHLITQAIDVCSGENVFAALTLPAPTVGIEAVLAANPEAIIAGTDHGVQPEWLDHWRRWKELPAVAGGHLYVVDADLLHRPGPRFLDGVDALCTVIDLARGSSTTGNPR